MKSADAGERAALVSTDFAAGILDAMIDAVLLVDAHSARIVAANRAAGALVGVAPPALCGSEVTELCASPEDLMFWRDAGRDGAASLESQTWLRRPDGAAVPVMRRTSRLCGTALCLVVLHDRSERCAIEAELESRVAELSSTLESTADGILVVDGAGHITSWNRRVAEMWRIPLDLLQKGDDNGDPCENGGKGWMNKLNCAMRPPENNS